MSTEAARSPRIDPVALDDPTAGPLVGRMMTSLGGGEPLELFRVVARQQELAQALAPITTFILTSQATDRVERELVILRTCALSRCATEWGIHAAATAGAGFTEEQLRQTWCGSDEASRPGGPQTWTAKQHLLLQLAEQIHTEGDVADTFWGSCRAHWSEEELLELVTAAGFYRLVCVLANTSRVAAEAWARPVPEHRLVRPEGATS